MGTFDLENPNPRPGDVLRDEAANLLSVKYGRPQREHRSEGKKVDIFVSRRDFGKAGRIYVEAKDYDAPLTREHVVHIWSDYYGIIKNNQPAILLLVTRRGLTADAQAYVDREISEMRHQTIWELENETLGLTEYVRSLTRLFEQDGLNTYYVESRARSATYSSDYSSRSPSQLDVAIFNEVQRWIDSNESHPVAVLGGYGAGKSSLAKRLISHQADRALADPLARRPVLIRLGVLCRYSSVEGLLGGMFTHEFPVDGFNVHHFMQLNAKGRLFIVLDGFDEMKHAMTWADFHSQIADLNKLTQGNSKIILMGRPSAFLSSEEHVHVLRGMKRFGEGWRQLPNWPEFREFDLQEFSPEERSEFVQKYLEYRRASGGPASEQSSEWISARAAETNQIASKAEGIFQKPVHAKILTDLAADPTVSLSGFSDGVSSWKLYEMFFSSLAEREVEKEARRPIGEPRRLEFLQDIAFWLWTERSGNTSFRASEVPDEIIVHEPGDNDLDALKREYLSGSFLERKGGDTYYFAHRSFAEFLVAQRMLSGSPTSAQHALYSDLVRDGVRQFLNEAPNRSEIGGWIENLVDVQGYLSLEYLSFLCDAMGGLPQLIAALPAESYLAKLLAVFQGDLSLRRNFEQTITRTMRKVDNTEFFLLCSLLQAQLAELDGRSDSKRLQYVLTWEITAAVLDRVFESAKVDDYGKAQIDPAAGHSRALAGAVITELREGDLHSERRFLFNGRRFAELRAEELRRARFDVGLQSRLAVQTPSVSFEIGWQHVLDRMSESNRAKTLKYFRRAKDLRGIYTREFIKSRTNLTN